MSIVQLEQIDKDAILRSLNLNPRDPKTQALLLVCDRYKLDPLLKHLILISGNAYITRDGYLAIAHRSGQFDGMEVLGQGETTTHHWATVAVWRRDMSHPFTYTGRYPKAKGGIGKEYAPEMAIKCAEVMGLRRAFNVTGVGAADERWDEVEPVSYSRPELVTAPDQHPDDGTPDPPCLDDASLAEQVQVLGARVAALPELLQKSYNLERKTFNLPSARYVDRWDAQLLTLATNLVDELEASEAARVASLEAARGRPAEPAYFQGEVDGTKPIEHASLMDPALADLEAPFR